MVRYVESADGIRPEQLDGFFHGWPSPPSSETHLELLRHSQEVVLAIDAESERVIGFVTAISDGVLCAYIPLLEVLPAWQRRGIGRALLQRLLQRLDDLYMVDLLCDPELQPIYEGLGMTRGQGMLLRNYDHQSGRPRGGERPGPP